jgi:hypothetical protein
LSKSIELKWVLPIAALALLLAVSPFAHAGGQVKNSLTGGKRNPTTRTYKSETRIMASTGGYGARVSNRSTSGGGAIDVCRSGPGGTPQRQEPCLRSTNRNTGLAFELDTKGAQAGTITTAGGDGTKPFTTNATGVATGLNAERVGSRTPAQLTSDAVAAVQATMSFARVLENGTMSAARGVDAAARNSTGIYSVVFHSDVSKCGLTATESAAGSEVGPVGVQLGPDHRTATVTTMNAQSPAAPADRAFSITALC